jgi:hypothetical protein
MEETLDKVILVAVLVLAFSAYAMMIWAGHHRS